MNCCKCGRVFEVSAATKAACDRFLIPYDRTLCDDCMRAWCGEVLAIWIKDKSVLADDHQWATDYACEVKL